MTYRNLERDRVDSSVEEALRPMVRRLRQNMDYDPLVVADLLTTLSRHAAAKATEDGRLASRLAKSLARLVTEEQA